jgi:hypothetical protein
MGLGLVALAAPAFADDAPPDEPSAADRESARALMEQGRVAYEQKDYEPALQSFVAADKIMGVTSTGLWVGKSLAALGRLIEARDKLLAVGRIPLSADVSEALTEARAEAAELQASLAERIPELRFEVRGVAGDVDIVVHVGADEVPGDLLKVPRKVDPGEIVVRATAKGYAPVELKVNIAEGQSLPVRLDFKPGGSGDPAVSEPPDDTGYYVAVGVSFGVAGVGAVVGAVTGGLSLAAASDAKQGCREDGTGCPIANEETADRSLVLAHVSTVSFIVGGLGAAAGIVTLIIGPPEGEEAVIEPAIGPGWLGVTGRF